MPDDAISQIAQAQRDRLAFVELRLRFLGEIRRQDIVNRFGIQAAAATRDLALYKDLGPKNLEYNTKSKVYARTTRFNPVFDFHPQRVLTWLSQSFGDVEPSQPKPVLPCDLAPNSVNVDLEVLSVLTRAIHSQSVVEVSYRSLSSGLTTRELAPFAIANNGNRWHIRGFDRRSQEFRDFVLNRVVDAQLVSSELQPHETVANDIQWNRIVEIELVPHPANVQHPDTVEAEFGMKGGVLNLKVRASMVGYLMRSWNVDCTGDHSLKGTEYLLWLKNRQALYGVGNLVLAPGYDASNQP